MTTNTDAGINALRERCGYCGRALSQHPACAVCGAVRPCQCAGIDERGWSIPPPGPDCAECVDAPREASAAS